MDESDISMLEKTLVATQQAGDTYLKATLTKFLLKWTILIFSYPIVSTFLFWYKWLLLFLLPLFLFSLYQIYLQKKQFRQKIEEIQALIEEVKGL